MNFLLLLWLYPVFAIKDDSDYSMVSAIRKKIFDGYDPMARPVINHTHPINVGMIMRLLHFGLDSRQNLFDFLSYFRIEWSDRYLQWNASEYRGVKRINVRMDDVFTPDLILYDSIQPTNMMKKFNNTELIITNDGTVHWSPLLRMQSICRLNIQDWPYDQQKCSLIFISWSYPIDALALYISTKSINVRDLWPNNEWEVIGTSCDTLIVSDIPGRPDLFFPGVKYTISVRRRSTPYPYLIDAPIICTTIINIISIWLIDPFDPKRIRFQLNRLSFFIILITSFYPSYILGLGMFGTTRLVKFLGSMMVSSAVLMLWSALSMNIIQSTKPNPITEQIWRNMTQRALNWRLIRFNHYNIHANDANDDDDNGGDRQSSINEQRRRNYLFVILIDRVLLIIFLIIFFMFYKF
ncbi:hypothetical protein DERP_005020 [Dermatophagoides pteronyssinus]|uniref:Neurotransmitter-gated ion-channel ligand-binding domain-containing protein n=1 Tax=Dermatophagoides pteronyssinus TaxID=6956 RepID=A0ABQ8JU83_DERPT|nr:hypothetical protein DERP_005020 [Dermatophagoides pteronyssinus]